MTVADGGPPLAGPPPLPAPAPATIPVVTPNPTGFGLFAEAAEDAVEPDREGGETVGFDGKVDVQDDVTFSSAVVVGDGRMFVTGLFGGGTTFGADEAVVMEGVDCARLTSFWRTFGRMLTMKQE